MTPERDLITIPTIEDLTRRQFVSSALAAALLIACSSDDEPAAPQATTRIVETPMGPVEVPVAPQRIVAIDPYGTLQTLDELGAPLVAAVSSNGVRNLVSEGTKALPDVGSTNETNLEAIIAVQPDLIIGTHGYSEAIYEQLTVIAPTILLEHWPRDWREIYRDVANAAGQAAEANERAAALDARIAELEAAIARAWPNGVTVTVLDIRAAALSELRARTSFEQIYVYIWLLNQLQGVKLTADSLTDSLETSPVIPVERMRDADADVILYYIGRGSEASDAVAATDRELTGHPLWRSLNAVQAARAHRVDAGLWYPAGDFDSANLILDDLFTYLA